MSRTIITNSGSDFFTNVNSEMFLGEICKLVDAKYYHSPFFNEDKLAFNMTEEEAKEAGEKLLALIPKVPQIFKSYKHYFESTASPKVMIETLEYYSKCFIDSKGYDCI